MWAALLDYFSRYPAQERLARLLIRLGLRIADGRVWAGPVALGDSALGRAAGVDRRIVAATVATISQTPELARIFQSLQPVANLRDVAKRMDWGVLEIQATQASDPGILASVTRLVAEAGISIRQAIVDDPDFSDDPRLVLVTEKPVPADVLESLRRARGVQSLTVY